MTTAPMVSNVALVAETADVLILGRPSLAPEIERRRSKLIRESDRDDFDAARLLATLAIKVAGGGEVEPSCLRQRCERCSGPHGRPNAIGTTASVSWAHSRGFVAVIAGPSPRIGIDIERSRAVSRAVELVLHADEVQLCAEFDEPERMWLLAWTAKEALVKAGVTSLDDASSCRVLADQDGLLESVRGLKLSAQERRDWTAVAASPYGVTWIDATPQWLEDEGLLP